MQPQRLAVSTTPLMRTRRTQSCLVALCDLALSVCCSAAESPRAVRRRPQICWLVEASAWLASRKFPIGVMRYLFYPENFSVVMIGTSLHHVWFLPVAWSVRACSTAARGAWRTGAPRRIGGADSRGPRARDSRPIGCRVRDLLRHHARRARDHAAGDPRRAPRRDASVPQREHVLRVLEGLRDCVVKLSICTQK